MRERLAQGGVALGREQFLLGCLGVIVRDGLGVVNMAGFACSGLVLDPAVITPDSSMRLMARSGSLAASPGPIPAAAVAAATCLRPTWQRLS